MILYFGVLFWSSMDTARLDVRKYELIPKIACIWLQM